MTAKHELDLRAIEIGMNARNYSYQYGVDDVDRTRLERAYIAGAMCGITMCQKVNDEVMNANS